MKPNFPLILCSIIAIPVLILIFLSMKEDAQEDQEKVKSIKNEFGNMNDPYIQKEEINGYVISSELGRLSGLRGANFITVSDGHKFSIGGNTRNYLYPEDNIGNFIQPRDSIFKRKNSDTIFIYRDKKEYYFKIGKLLNRPK